MTHPIVQKWLDGKNDAGGTISALEERLVKLENILIELQNNPNIELGDVGFQKIEDALKVTT